MPANTGAAGAMHRVGCFAAKAAPTGVRGPLASSLLYATAQLKGLGDFPTEHYT